jgi:L-fuconolactonase
MLPFMLIDSHHHFWRYDAEEYAWIDDAMNRLRRDYLARDLEEVAWKAGVTGVVSVQARESLAETEFLLGLGGDCALVRGVVGWAPLADPGVGDILDRWAGQGLFKGVREVMQGREDEEFFGNPSFHRGLRELTRRGLPYDVLVYANQLPATIRMVDAHPEQRFLLDHLAKPAIRGGGFPKDWARDVRMLAERENVLCKLSGMVTEVRDPAWHLELLRPYFDHVLEAFGPERLMFGSDWPVCLLRVEYGTWVEVARSLTEGLAESERDAFFAGTATKAYGL